MAEAHPVGFQWVMEAKERGATIIHVDPRFSRTSAMADLYVPIRAGADIAFVGGLINYVLQNEQVLPRLRARLHERGRRSSTRTSRTPRTWTACSPASTRSTGATTGRPGGTRATTSRARPAAPAAWSATSEREVREAARGEAHGSGGAAAHPAPDTDETLQHPRCVFQVLKRHFARYTPEMVAEVAGVPEELFRQVCPALITENSGRDRTTAFVYSAGLDPAHGGRAVHPDRGHPAVAARQHGPARRRHPGDARARLHPGLHRHPDAVRPAARLPADAVRARRPARRPGRLRRGREDREGLLGQHPRTTWSACSRRTGATRPPRTTTSASTTCPG